VLWQWRAIGHYRLQCVARETEARVFSASLRSRRRPAARCDRARTFRRARSEDRFRDRRCTVGRVGGGRIPVDCRREHGERDQEGPSRTWRTRSRRCRYSGVTT